jgi:hypothetical protein
LALRRSFTAPALGPTGLAGSLDALDREPAVGQTFLPAELKQSLDGLSVFFEVGRVLALARGTSLPLRQRLVSRPSEPEFTAANPAGLGASSFSGSQIRTITRSASAILAWPAGSPLQVMLSSSSS